MMHAALYHLYKHTMSTSILFIYKAAAAFIFEYYHIGKPQFCGLALELSQSELECSTINLIFSSERTWHELYF